MQKASCSKFAGKKVAYVLGFCQPNFKSYVACVGSLHRSLIGVGVIIMPINVLLVLTLPQNKSDHQQH